MERKIVVGCRSALALRMGGGGRKRKRRRRAAADIQTDHLLLVTHELASLLAMHARMHARTPSVSPLFFASVERSAWTDETVRSSLADRCRRRKRHPLRGDRISAPG